MYNIMYSSYIEMERIFSNILSVILFFLIGRGLGGEGGVFVGKKNYLKNKAWHSDDSL